jgi:hypothetical protein
VLAPGRASPTPTIALRFRFLFGFGEAFGSENIWKPGRNEKSADLLGALNVEVYGIKNRTNQRIALTH